MSNAESTNFIFDNNQISIDTGILLNHIPCPIAIKSADSVYLGCNDVMASLSGFANQDQLIGKRDFELNCPAAEMHDIFVSQDQQTLTESQPLKSIDFCIYSDLQLHVCFTVKKKLVDQAQRDLVLFTITEFSPDQLKRKFHKLQINLPELNYNDKVSFTLCKTYPNSSLSLRESQCFYYLLRGYSAAQTATALGLSSKRTVEEYIDRIKTKLHCHSKKELIAYGFENRLTHYIPESLI